MAPSNNIIIIEVISVSLYKKTTDWFASSAWRLEKAIGAEKYKISR